MIDPISVAILIGAAIPVFALHAYLVSQRKKKSWLRASAIVSALTICASMVWIWSIMHDESSQSANGLAAAFATWIAAAGILALQIGFLVPDFVAGSKKRRPVGGIENGGPNLK